MAAMPPFFTGRSFFRDAELPPVNPMTRLLLNFTSSFDPSRTALSNSSLISNKTATGAERRYYLLSTCLSQSKTWSVSDRFEGWRCRADRITVH